MIGSKVWICLPTFSTAVSKEDRSLLHWTWAFITLKALMFGLLKGQSPLGKLVLHSLVRKNPYFCYKASSLWVCFRYRSFSCSNTCSTTKQACSRGYSNIGGCEFFTSQRGTRLWSHEGSNGATSTKASENFSYSATELYNSVFTRDNCQDRVFISSL